MLKYDNMARHHHHTTWAEVSVAALINNISIMRTLHAQNEIIAVVKANAYGHGIEQIARICIEQNIQCLAVNATAEFLQLDAFIRQTIPEQHAAISILIMGDPGMLPPQQDFSNAIFVVGNFDLLTRLQQQRQVLKIHLKFDTGLSRLGFSLQQIPALLDALDKARNIVVDGVMSHLANVEDVSEPDYMNLQISNFQTCAQRVAQHIKPEQTHSLKRHIGASASTILYPASHFSATRIGISLYGLWPSRVTRLSSLSQNGKIAELEPALSWKAKIVHVAKVKKGGYVGYGCTYRCTRNTLVAVIPVGYYEGYDRGLSGKSYVLINGDRAPLIGRICMNMAMIDVTNCSPQIGDIVTLIGKDGDDQISADDLANFSGTINYEVVSRIHAAIPKYYI